MLGTQQVKGGVVGTYFLPYFSLVNHFLLDDPQVNALVSH